MAHHPASIFIWAQVGLDPDGAPDHSLPLCSGLEFPALRSNPFNASHTSSPGDKVKSWELNQAVE